MLARVVWIDGPPPAAATLASAAPPCNPGKGERGETALATVKKGGGQNARATGGPGILPETKDVHLILWTKPK